MDFKLLQLEFQYQDPAPIQHVLSEYTEVFSDPDSLPPKRLHDHEIVLKEGCSPVYIRPYRYPQVQKDEIEKQVKEMLLKGIIFFFCKILFVFH
ncbi:hypothetical protein ACHQM5_006738 [Ranunculus cassubicifolius]